MARIFKVSPELAARKRALVEESEVYRELLKLQIRNVTLYSLSLQRKMTSGSGARSILLMALPFLAKFFMRSPSRRKGSSQAGTLGLAFTAFQMVRRFAPIVKNLFATFLAAREKRRERAASILRF